MNKSPKVVIIIRDDTVRSSIIKSAPTPVVVVAPPPPVTVPGAPVNIFAELILEIPSVPGNVVVMPLTATSASVSFTAPLSNGGSAITGYTVTSAPGNITATGTVSPIVVTGLTTGASYTFTVHATNASGDGPESAAAGPITIAIAIGDPYFTSVSLLLHCEVGPGGTLIDSSPRPKAVSSIAAPTFSSSLFKFGTSSLYRDSYDEFTIPASTDDLQFGGGDFTIETWVYPVTAFFGPVLLLEGQTDGITAQLSSYEFRFGPGSTSRVYTDFAGGPNGPNGADYLCAGPNPNVGEWSHIAIVRSGSNLFSFLNGVLVGQGAIYGSVNVGSTDYPNRMLKVDGTGQAMPFDGYIDDLRITKGVARYTSNFPVPTATFPDQ